MRRRRVAVVQSIMVPGGGTEGVTAWMVEALKGEYDVALITFSDMSSELLNRFYATELSSDQFSMIRPPLFPLLLRTRRFSLLKDHLMQRYCKSVQEKFDLFIGSGPMDFGCPGVQYLAMGPDSTLAKIITHDPGVSTGYYLTKRSIKRLFESVSGFSNQRMIGNTSLVNSNRTGQVVDNVYGIKNYQVVYPPAIAPPSNTPWHSRRNGFLCIARIEPYKLIDQIIHILKRVRENGVDVSLQIVGRSDDPNYYRRIEQLRDQNSSWIFLDSGCSREELFSLMNGHKYGISGALDEHFGMAVAEMVKAGCIVFVPNGGGQTEIVDTPELIYENADDAVDKITRVLNDEGLQKRLLDRMGQQSKIFSTQAFCGSMQRVVHQFFAAA